MFFHLTTKNVKKNVSEHGDTPARYQPQPADVSVWSAGYGLTWPQLASHLSASALHIHCRRRWLTQSASDNRWWIFICSVCWLIAEWSLSIIYSMIRQGSTKWIPDRQSLNRTAWNWPFDLLTLISSVFYVRQTKIIRNTVLHFSCLFPDLAQQ